MPTSRSRKAGSARYHHRDLRRALLHICREQLRSGGLEAVSLRKAAQEIGVSHAAPSRHFSDKRALLTALAAQGFADAAQALDGARPAEGDRLQAVCDSYVAFGATEPDLYALMAQPKLIDLSDPALAEPRHACFAILQSALDDTIDGVTPDLETRTVALWSFLHGFVMLSQGGVLGHEQQDTPTVPTFGPLLWHVRSGITSD